MKRYTFFMVLLPFMVVGFMAGCVWFGLRVGVRMSEAVIEEFVD